VLGLIIAVVGYIIKQELLITVGLLLTLIGVILYLFDAGMYWWFDNPLWKAGLFSGMANEPRIETFQGLDGQFYNRIQAANGEVLMVSEGYPDRGTAEDNISAMKDAMLDIVNEETKPDA
jgi:uncharacterized protein YegP (UPF0339 family)